MTGALAELAVSNLLTSSALAVLAYLLHRRGRYPALAHLLWVLVMVKAVTPPLLVLPVTAGPGVLAPAASLASSAPSAVVAGLPTAGSVASWLLAHASVLLVAAWLLGSGVVLVVSIRRIRHFDRELRRTSHSAPPAVAAMAAGVAGELGLRSVPSVALSRARISPMTWWTGRRPRVILPAALLDGIGDGGLRLILAHEFAHLQRRDHLVRWLEWLALVAAWWNPAVWLARRCLRRDEEDATDSLVVARLGGHSRAYARLLLEVLEVLATSGRPATALATGIEDSGSLERRLRRIVSPACTAPTPRLLAAGAITFATALASLGLAAAAPPPLVVPAPAPEALAAEGRYGQVSAVVAPGRSVGSERVFVGSDRADSFTGTGADETIVGGAGADRLGGGPGRDTIRGGDGNDTLRGGAGADELAGDHGRDTIGGGAGDDTIAGGPGADVIRGGAGRDTILAGSGDDIVRTWADGTADYVDCGEGRDRAVVDSQDTTERCESVVRRDE